ncbi:MAG: ribosome maturation factor RimM [Phyllobacteriaceae bacterium]|nr:ribosome maturation factor RimM [Phyllobacteriaceae bacterium]MBA90852.1 ribosome maturation factor RimM [Phyllobacteriaceae bacterium]
MKKNGKDVRMAVIGAPHGVRGELRVKSFTADPLAIGDYGPLHDAEGRLYEVLDVRPAKTVVVVRFKGVTTREQAEALNGVELLVARDALPDEDLEEDEFFHADLVGLDVRDGDGKRLGKVTALQDFGGGDLLEITLGGRKGVLIPFTMAAVPVVDVEGGFVTIEPVAAGLVDTGDEDDGAEPEA